MRRVVCDTGPLLHLQEAGVRDLLASAGEIYIPHAVDQELSHHEAAWPAHKPAWVHITALTPASLVEAQAWQQAGLLHFGEAHAIALARQLKTDWLLTDDTAARFVAQSLGIETHGSIGFVLWAASNHHLTRTDAEAALDRLAESSLWVSRSVLAAAKAALKELV